MVAFIALASVLVAAASSFAAPAGMTMRRQSVGQTLTGGSATFYFQGGAAGSCGNVNPDSALIVAVQAQSYNAANCGRQVRVTNTQNGRSVVATIADRCPTCQNNPNSLDLSQGAFDAIADEA
ncbi:barwin-like endoglucanase [Peniophora sp. CONT]|nr:barwin-like endoglucanase [Peniophora sp. CONT]